MNLLLVGKETAQTMGLPVKTVTVVLLVITSLMVSATVSYSGLLGFVGLVMPHLLRLIWGPDHRVLVPACILGGSAYLVFCDLLARTLPQQGEMPAGVITALDWSARVHFSSEKIETMKTAFAINNLSHAFGTHTVLKNLSFSITGGDFFIIIGPNGSGKTTLMKLMAGVLKTGTDRIRIFERDIRNFSYKSLARESPMFPSGSRSDFRLPWKKPF